MEKKDRKYLFSIILSFIIVLLVLVDIYRINYSKKDYKFLAKEGVLDLREWDLEKEEIIRLDGEWEFYPGKLIEPDYDFNSLEKEYIEVPKDWESNLKGQALKNGSGSYRLRIKVPRDMTYAIKSRTIRFSNRIYFNGEKLAQVGNPSTDRRDYIPGSRYTLIADRSIDGEIEVLIHVTSLDYSSGGILKSIKLGSLDSMLALDKKNTALDVLAVVISLTLSVYFFVIYLQRYKDIHLAYFSGFNLFMGLYLSTMNEQIISLVYNYKPLGRTEIQALFIVFTSIFFLKFVHHFFKEISSKRITNILIGMIFSVFSYSIIGKYLGKLLPLVVLQALIATTVIAAYIYATFILIKAIKKEKDLSEFILITLVSVVSYWITMFIKVFLEIDLGNTPIFLIITTMFSVSAMMSQQFQLDYKRASDLTQKLIRDDRLKDEFLIKASHKLRTPIQIIFNSSRELLEGKDGNLGAIQQKNLFKIQQEVDIMGRITEDLLDASLIKSGNTKLRIEVIKPYTIIGDILKEVGTFISYNKEIEIENKVDSSFPNLLADPNKFRQIIYDLFYNAIKYTDSGSISIHAKIVGMQAEFIIKDSGRGISEENLDRIFEVFYQENPREHKDQGLGLGLPIVKDLIEAQGGRIRVESKKDQGTNVIFTLPLADESLQVKGLEHGDFRLENDDLKEAEKLNEERILIIENDKSEKGNLKETIEKLNYRTIGAKSGREALDILAREKMDLIILDYILPDMTSRELCQKIREDYSIGELPILILTSSNRTKDLIRSFNYGVNDFQEKPINLEELKSRIQSLLLIKSSAEEGLEKEFQYFYSQISPHFLYNTLNSIIGLSYKDGEKSRKALNNLAVYLRGKLDIHRKRGFVSLESELELLSAYLEIEELRYGDRLKIEYSIEDGLEGKIPPLTLQPLVENAVNHGIAANGHGLIRISTLMEKEGFITIRIEDNGRGMSEEKRTELLDGIGNGIGFKNVMERIKRLRGASLSLESSIEEGTTIKIIIPGGREHEDYFD